MADKKYYLKAPEELGGQLFVEASDGVTEYTTLVNPEYVNRYKGEFSNDDILDLIDKYPILRGFEKVEVPKPKKYGYILTIDDTSLYEKDLFLENMLLVHNRDDDVWSIVPNHEKELYSWNYLLTEEEVNYIKDNYRPLYDSADVEIVDVD